MNILTKAQATRAIRDSLFTPGGTLALEPKERFDRGKYKPSIVGREVPAGTTARLVWAEPRRDKDGPYLALFCIPAAPQPKPGWETALSI